MKVDRIIRKIIGPALFIGIVVGITTACTNTECYDNKNSLPLAGFYSSEKIPASIALDSITILGVGVPGDSILQDSVRGLSQVYLPFRIDQNSTTYEIQYLAGVPGIFHLKDYITFNYEIKPMFVSTACGAVYYYEITSIEHTDVFIDSVTCPSGVITNANMENLKIYFRVDAEEE